MMTEEAFSALNLPVENTPENLLSAESALEWIRERTDLVFDLDNPGTLEALPAGARLFIVKYIDAMGASESVVSESIAGMSQSFDRTNRDRLLSQLAKDLLGGWLKSQIRFHTAKRRW